MSFQGMSDLSSGVDSRWGSEADHLLRSRAHTVSMSRSRLFLGGSVSTGARLRFTGRPYVHSTGRNL